ncbi:Protein transport protein S9 plasma membrane t-SNARE [Arthrobotrys musiformis]|uniref:Protein transport protein S9 plasma membrane t-SNARE n=1 Tax=Arthrobotrys musiformis TaxID=47236 RepID=A0AAV9WJJ6_9PEZI
MGLFKKKDKTARLSPAPPAGVPDTAARAQPSKNPYAYSPPASNYTSQPAYSQPTSYGRQPYEPTTYGRQNNEPTSYGGASTYDQGPTEPTPYGGTSTGFREPPSYGASLYNNDNKNNNRQSNPPPTNPYGNSNPYSNPYGGPPPPPSNQYNPPKPQPGPGTYSSATAGPGSYGYGGNTYQETYSYQSTAFAEDEQDPEAIKQEIKFTKYASHASTVNALHAAARAEQAGQSTLLSLEEQGGRLYSTQLNLKLAKTHGDTAIYQAGELKVANRPLFMPHAKNPFSSGRNKIVDEQVELERQRRERTERGGGAAKLTHEEKMRKMGLAPVGAPKPISKEERAAREKQRAMYQFEADEEDDQLERDIDTNLDLLAGASTRLRGIAGDINRKVDEQNRLIVDITAQAQDVDDGLARAGHKLRPYGY